MLESIASNNIFEYKKLTPEEQKRRGILGRLVGVIADSKNPTRNGRKYSAELWEKVFSNPIMQEKIENRVCFGEACHPIDGREEVDPEKIAICLAEVPKKNKKGQLIGVFDVLDTPCGRILKTMLDYGANIGVSSRGSGEVGLDDNGDEAVDPDSYDCICWDAVFVPAVKEARLQLVSESLGNKTLKQALQESLDASTAEERKIMQETLEELHIDYKPEKVHNIEESVNTSADDVRVALEELQTSLLDKQQLEKQVLDLQEKLSVCYAKEANSVDKIAVLESKVSKLSEGARTVGKLKECVKTQQTKIDALVEELEQTKQIASSYKSKYAKEKQLAESLKVSVAKTEAKSQDVVSSLNEQLSTDKAHYQDTIDKLHETVAELKKDAVIKNKEYRTKLAEALGVSEKYQNIAKHAVDRYLQSQADQLGVTVNEIKSRLSESYSFKDIDLACADIKNVQINISTLPFAARKGSSSVKKMVFTESIDPIVPQNNDDVIDESLQLLAAGR